MTDRPQKTMTEYFEYLDDLRDSGVTNMFGSGRYLMRDFGITLREASRIAGLWMKTFDSEISPDVRAAEAEGTVSNGQ